MTDRPWFTDKNFTALEIRKNRSLADHAVVRSVTMTDATYIAKLAGRIEQIPPDGDMMISFSGAVEHIELVFHSDGKIHEIDVIQKGFKTPSTGFITKNDYEKELYSELDALLLQRNPLRRPRACQLPPQPYTIKANGVDA